MSAANDRRWTPKLAAIDANLLVALDALLQEVSVTRAARRMGVTQSAMSQTLSRLRSQLDDPLLVRAGRGMEPTPFVRRFAGRLRAAIAELEAVVHDRPAFDPVTTPRRFVVAMVDYLAWCSCLRSTSACRAPRRASTSPCTRSRGTPSPPSSRQAPSTCTSVSSVRPSEGSRARCCIAIPSAWSCAPATRCSPIRRPRGTSRSGTST